MSTYREMVYMVNDELKLVSDDAFYTNEHVLFLLDKFRSFLLKKEYGDATNSYGRQSIAARKYVPETNYQTICLDLETVDSIPGLCEYGKMVRSIETLPPILQIGIRSVYPVNYYHGQIQFVERERMKFVGNDRWRANVIYASVGPDGHLWLKSRNPQYLYLKKVRLTAVFDEPSKAADLDCENQICDVLDMTFPLEEALLAPALQLTVQELSRPLMGPEDIGNNAMDDTAAVRNSAAAVRKSNDSTDNMNGND